MNGIILSLLRIGMGRMMELPVARPCPPSLLLWQRNQSISMKKGSKASPEHVCGAFEVQEQRATAAPQCCLA